MRTGETTIKMFGMDVDGVLTDGGIYYGDGGLEIKRFHAQDGMGLAMLARAGIITFIITGRKCEAVARRARELGVAEVHQGIADKLACLTELLARHGASLEEVAFVGDDLADLEVLGRVGFPIAVANARDEVKRAAGMITAAAGGNGAIREAGEWAIKHNGQWDDLLAGYVSPPGRREDRG